MENQKIRNKCFAFLIPILVLILANSCQQSEANSKTNIKKKFYKILSKENQLLSYNYRIYHFDNDTLQEKCTTFSLDGKIKGNFTNQYLIKVPNIYILFRIDNKINKSLYFSTEKLDSCYNIHQKFDKFKICYKGLNSDSKYKNAHRIYYEEIAYDGSIENLILDKDFTLISRYSENNSQKKEIVVDSIEVPEKIRNSANTIR